VLSPAAGTSVSQGLVHLCAPCRGSNKRYKPLRLAATSISCSPSQNPTLVQFLIKSIAIRSARGKLVRSPPTPKEASSCTDDLNRKYPTYITLWHAVPSNLPPFSTHHTLSSPKTSVHLRGSSHNRKETKKSRKPQKNLVRRTLPASSTPPPLSSDFPFHDRTSQVKGKQRIRLSAL
jgi:hypothetical protein